MRTYTIRILSFYEHQPQIFKAVLECPTMAQLIFPCSLLISPNQQKHFETSQEFDVLPLLDFLAYENTVLVHLQGDNGIKISITIQTEGITRHNVMKLEFTNAHLESNIMTYTNLKLLIADLVSVFKANQATVFDTAIHNHRRKLRFFTGPQNKRYPLEMGWISFFNLDLVEFIGIKQFDGLSTCAEKIRIDEGIIIALQKEPFNADDINQREYEAQAIEELGLNKIANA